MIVKTCASCKYCVMPDAAGGGLLSGNCTAVIDPITGDAMPVKIARQDTWQGYKLTCGYVGALWSAKN